MTSKTLTLYFTPYSNVSGVRVRVGVGVGVGVGIGVGLGVGVGVSMSIGVKAGVLIGVFCDGVGVSILVATGSGWTNDVFLGGTVEVSVTSESSC